MGEILDGLQRHKDKSVKIGDANGVPLGLYPHEYKTNFDTEEAILIRGLRLQQPGVDVLSFKDAVALLPNIFQEKGVIEGIMSFANQSDLPTRIDSVFLQKGLYAIHFLHTFEWDDFVVPVVSYIPRGDTKSIVGQQAVIDARNLPRIGKILSQHPEEVRVHTDINVPILSTTVKDIPLYFTPLDETRAEIEAVASLSRTDTPILRYLNPETNEMKDVNALQNIVRKALKTDRSKTAIEYIQKQFIRLAESHAVLAQLAGYLPKFMNINAGDWMGTMDLESGISRLKLMTMKGGVSLTQNEDEWMGQMRMYTFLKGKSYRMLFSSLDDDMLHEAWENAGSLIDSPQTR